MIAFLFISLFSYTCFVWWSEPEYVFRMFVVGFQLQHNLINWTFFRQAFYMQFKTYRLPWRAFRCTTVFICSLKTALARNFSSNSKEKKNNFKQMTFRARKQSTNTKKLNAAGGIFNNAIHARGSCIIISQGELNGQKVIIIYTHESERVTQRAIYAPWRVESLCVIRFARLNNTHKRMCKRAPTLWNSACVASPRRIYVVAAHKEQSQYRKHTKSWEACYIRREIRRMCLMPYVAIKLAHRWVFRMAYDLRETLGDILLLISVLLYRGWMEDSSVYDRTAYERWESFE